MCISTTATAFMTNPQIKPLFLEYTSVILIKDYTQSDPFCSRSLTKGAVGNIIICGLFIYAYDQETNDYTKFVDRTECCFIEVATPTANFDN